MASNSHWINSSAADCNAEAGRIMVESGACTNFEHDDRRKKMTPNEVQAKCPRASCVAVTGMSNPSAQMLQKGGTRCTYELVRTELNVHVWASLKTKSLWCPLFHNPNLPCKVHCHTVFHERTWTWAKPLAHFYGFAYVLKCV